MRLVACVVVAGCLGPQVSDLPGASGDIVAMGTVIPSIDEVTDDAALIAANDGVDGVVPRLSAFAEGAPIHVWSFGPAPAFAAPLYQLVKRQSDGTLVRIPHNSIAGVIPGDPGYSPYWQIFALVVTDAYNGELITSSTAIEEAERAGLIEAPKPQDGVARNCPAVASDIRLDVGGATPVPPNALFYYEHHTVAYYDFGPMPVTQAVHVAAAKRYVLRRDGAEPLSEPIRGVDMDGDGDILDSNDIYERTATDAMRSPLCQRVDVAVAPSIASIDTTGDETRADLESAAQMFAPDPVQGTVISVEQTDELTNCPAQRIDGAL